MSVDIRQNHSPRNLSTFYTNFSFPIISVTTETYTFPWRWSQYFSPKRQKNYYPTQCKNSEESHFSNNIYVVNSTITYICLSLPFILLYFCLFFPQTYIHTEIYSIMNYYLYLSCNFSVFFISSDIWFVYTMAMPITFINLQPNYVVWNTFTNICCNINKFIETCMFNRQCSKRLNRCTLRILFSESFWMTLRLNL
jgi:hypothetical protein